jgi:hypothetical protein
MIALFPQVADADSPVRSTRRWPWRIPHTPSALGPMAISTADNELKRQQMVDMSFLLSRPGIGEVRQDADELSGDRNRCKGDDVGRHGAPT